MKKRFFANGYVNGLASLTLAAVGFLGISQVNLEAEETGWYIFTSFHSNGQDGLHLSLSRDGYSWKELNDGKSFLKSDLGAKLMRDPSIAKGPDGTFHLVWTSGWTTAEGTQFGYASSKDLIHWTTPRGVSVMKNEPKTRNVWAPEIFYDPKGELWYIFWSSTVVDKFPDSTGVSEDKYNHRAYYVTTKDFETFSESKLFFDPGFNNIDSTMFMNGDDYVLICKDERLTPPQKNLRLAIASSPTGPFEFPDKSFTIHWVEGPTVLKIKDTWICYFDCYAKHRYGAMTSKDLKTWEDITEKVSFPEDHRHGTVFEVSEELGKKLQTFKSEEK